MSSMLKKGRKEFKPSGPRIRKASVQPTRQTVERQSQTPAPVARHVRAAAVVSAQDVGDVTDRTHSKHVEATTQEEQSADYTNEPTSTISHKTIILPSKNRLKRKARNDEESAQAKGVPKFLPFDTRNSTRKTHPIEKSLQHHSQKGSALPKTLSVPSASVEPSPATPSGPESIETLPPISSVIDNDEDLSTDLTTAPIIPNKIEASQGRSLASHALPGISLFRTLGTETTQAVMSLRNESSAVGEVNHSGLGAAGDLGLSAAAVELVAQVSQVVPMAAIIPNGTSIVDIEEPVAELENSRKRRPLKRRKVLSLDSGDMRATIEMQLNKPHRIAGERRLRRKKEEGGKGKKRRALTPEGAEEDVVDHSSVKMSDLCRDLRIGKKFSKHDEIKQRLVQKKVRSKLSIGQPEPLSLMEGRDAGSAQPEMGLEVNSEPILSTGPQMRVIDGQIVLDDSSLQIDRHKRALAEGIVMEEVEENEFTRITTSGTLMKREKAQIWDVAANDMFYRGLRMFGTDFEMIAKMFPHRNRRQIKLKFNKEERTNHAKINKALMGEKTSIDLEEYQTVTGLIFEEVADIEAERERIEAEQLGEQERHAAEAAEATRKKKEAILAKSMLSEAVPTIADEPTVGTESAKENEPIEDKEASTAPKSRKKALKKSKKNPHSSRGGGEQVEVLGTI